MATACECTHSEKFVKVFLADFMVAPSVSFAVHSPTMNLKIGIVGLPNVGKSTLFNALTKSQKAEAANFPFCTIEPNTGLVNVPDGRLDALAAIVKPERVMPSAVEFVDIAGLVAGASEGEGLGNKFLSHIRECQAICHVVRAFDGGDVHHVNGKVNPAEDLETIVTELILADLQSVQKQKERWAKKTRVADKEAVMAVELITRIEAALEDGKPARSVEVSEDEANIYTQLFLLTAKPYLIVANVAEDQYGTFDVAAFTATLGPLAEGSIVVPICAQIEAELAELDGEEAAEYLNDIGADKSGLESLIRAGFELLGLQSYFTAGVKEVRSWTIKKGATGPQAAGAIHTDFERGFIRATVVAYEDFIAHGGEAGAKEAGKLRTEGKEYIVKDGDVMHFRFNV